jgi:hypothetical protein
MRRAAMSCLLILVAVASAAAQDARKWMFDDNTDGVVLQYGTPESDDAVIAFICEPQAKQMRISEFIGSESLVPGTTAALKLTSGTQTITYNGQALSNEESGTANIEVTTAIDRKLFALLKAGPTLIVDLPGKQETIPLKSGAAQVAQFEKACLKR